MVFESVVTDVLNKVLGEYIENLDRKQLKIGIWGGDVVLENLKIRENALDDLDLPVQLIYGYLGKLVMKIPWKNLYSQPVIVQIEDLYALITPKQSVQYDAEKEEKYDLQVKQTALNALAEAAKRDLEKDKPKPDAGFAEKLTAQIVNNLQVKIANVHVRYEDITTTGHPFSFGISLHELELCTTDGNWEKCYMTEQASRVFKIANLSCLSAYMNCNGKRYAEYEKKQQEELFRLHIARKDSKPAQYSYVLGPISCNAKLKLNMNPEYDDPPFEIPKIDLCLEMEKLNVGLTSSQFQNIIKLADSMNRMQLGIPYRKYRPYNKPYKGNYKEWWHFAINSVLEDVSKRNRTWTWAHIKNHRELCYTYAEKYKERELSKKPLATLVESCTLLEKKLDLFNLILIRKRVDIEIAKKREAEAKESATKSGWFGGWFGGGKKSDDEGTGNIVQKFEAAMTKDEKNKLYKAIGYEENAVPLDIPEHYQAIKMDFKLVALEVGLYDDSDKSNDNYDYSDLPTIMLLNFSMATCSLSQRPAANAISVTAGMREMNLTGLDRDGVQPNLIHSKITDDFNLLDIFFETNPIDKSCDHRLKVVARPLQITYDSQTILRLIELFSPPKSVNLSEIEGAASARISNFKERSATGMQYMIDQHGRFDLDVLFMPNILIVPHGGFYRANEKSLIVVSLGQLHITSVPHERSASEMLTHFKVSEDKGELLKNVMDNAYDKFNVELDDMQVLVIKPNEPWQEALKSRESTDMHLLQPTRIEVTAALCLVADDPRLPKTKIDIVLPTIQINVTENRIYEMLGVLTSLPLPENKEPPSNLKRGLSNTSLRSSISNFLTHKDLSKKSKNKVQPTVIEEIIQYTDLELNFALKEISIVLYKTYDLDESTTTSPEDYGTPLEDYNNTTDMSLENQPSFLTRLSGVRNAQQLMSVQVLQVETYLAQRTYEMVASVKLGAINIKQFDTICKENYNQPVDIIDTPGYSENLQYLLTISYTSADKKSPEFATKYNSTEQLIVVNFTTLNMILHQELLKCLLQLANGFQSKIDEILNANKPRDRVGSAGDGYIVSNLAVILEEEATVQKSPTKQLHRSRSTKVVESIKLRLDANLNQVGLLLTTRNRDLASLKVAQLGSSVTIKSSYTEVNLGLKNIVVTDLNPKTIHTNILSVVGQEALKCQVILYNVDETSHYNADDMKIFVEVGCVKIVFLNWFVTGILSFLNNFQAAQQAIAQASAAAADAAKQNAIDAYQNATRMKLNIQMKAPIIVVPVDSQSTNALAVDFGMLTLSNITNEIPISEGTSAVIDEIKLELKDMKISKVVIVNDDSASTDEIDASYGLKASSNILNPTCFTLRVKRNLSSSWYHDQPEISLSGRLKSIQLNIFMDDYGLIMSILNRNLSEGVDEFPPPDEIAPVVSTPTRTENKIDTKSNKTTHSQTDKNIAAQPASPLAKIYEQLKFNFQFDGVIINLMESQTECLARFGIYFLSVKGAKLIDGTLSASIVLCNMQLDDMRPTTNNQIKQYLCRKDWTHNDYPEEGVDECYDDRNYMIEVTAIIKENDTFAEVRVCGFDLIVCIEFLLKITSFLVLPEDQNADESQRGSTISAGPVEVSTAHAHTGLVKSAVSVPSQVAPQKKMNLILHIDEPDIILVESLNDPNANAIVFNAQARLNYRAVDEKQIINGEITSLKMYMCSFAPERREATKHYILHPCVISLQGSTPEEQGLHIALQLSDIILNVSPATIELFNKAAMSISVGTAEKTSSANVKDYSDIWYPKQFKAKNYWFMRPEQAVDALNFESEEEESKQIKSEKCVIEVPCITIVIESGVGYYTTPLISFDTRLTAVISDWSHNMAINGSLTLSMNYYNKSLAEWEPIIELNEHVKPDGTSDYTPWELNFNLDMEKVQSEFDDNVMQNTTSIKINSDNNLELTLSKTCVTVLGEISEAFSQAIDSKGLTKPQVIAPFVVENDTGFEITLNFSRGIFTLHEVHVSQDRRPTLLNASLVFKSDQSTPNINVNDIKSCTISPGGRAYLQTKDLSSLQAEEDEEYNIYVKLGDIYKEVVLPVSKSDVRYFSLMGGSNSDPWGIISDVSCQYGTTKINIHGVVNVKNYFTTSIKIYRRKSVTNEMIFVGEVGPDKIFHVPLHAVYADSKELYFSLSDYKTSVQGIRWTESPSDTQFMRQLQCDPIDTFEPLYINVKRVKTEVFYENSTKFKLLSAFYTLELRPPLYLRNALPIDIKVSVAGCSVRQTEPSHSIATDNEPTLSEDEDIIDDLNPYMKGDFLDYGEKEVSPGDVLHLPTVKLTGKRKETRSFLVVRLIQYLEKDWSCATEISDEYNDTITWTFSSYDSAVKMEMDLYVRFTNRHGSLDVTIFSPFWFINKTGQMLTYKTDLDTVEVLYHPPEYTGPILFSFRGKLFFEKKKASIRVDNGDWSEKIPLDVAGSTGSVTCHANDTLYYIGVHNHLTNNSLTKQITFIPYYIASNKASFPIYLQEQSRPGDPWLEIAPNQCVPIWPKSKDDHKIIARVDDQRTAAFNYTDVNCTLLKLENNKYGGINVDVQSTEGGVYITFTQYNNSDAPGLIINHTRTSVIYYEKNSEVQHILGPKHKVLYAWSDPMGPRKLIFGKNKEETDLKRDGLGELLLDNNLKVFWISFLDGLQRVLLFTEEEAIATKTESSSALQTITQTVDLHIHGIGLSVINNESGVDILYLGVTSSGIIWESKKESKKRFKQMNMHDSAILESLYQQYQHDTASKKVQTYTLDNKYPVDFARMKLKKNTDRNIKRSFYPGIWVSLKSSPFQNQLHVKINKIQLDNQLLDPIFPVVLAPIAPPKSVATTTALKPFIECSVVQRVIPNSNVKQYKYASILMQEFHFKVDLLFLTAIAEMFTAKPTDANQAKLFRADVDSIVNPLSDFFETHSAQEQKNFYDNLHLGPLKIHVSFSMAGSETSALPLFLGTLVEGVGVTLTDVNDVVFRLAYFEREFQFFTQQQLISEITSHYTGQALKQLYVLVLGLDVLGNPYGLVVGLKKGVEDLFYEPFQGAIQGPGEFAEGLVLGVKSLFGHTVGGAAGAMSKITGAMGKGLAALTFDEDYQRKRRQAMNNKPKTFQEGIARSGKGLVMGFVDGVTGVVTKPVAGARDEGVEGFFKGLGKGAIGLVTRPTAGVVDFASGSFDAVKRATEGGEEVKRLRPLRFLQQDNVLRPYCLSKATGNMLLKELDKGKYATTDVFIHCEQIVRKEEFLVISNHRVIYVSRNDVFGGHTIHWTYMWQEINSVVATDRGVEIKVKKEGKKVLGFIGSRDTQNKILLVPDRSKRENLVEIMESQRKEI